MTNDTPFVYYFYAKRLVCEKGYYSEIYFQETVEIENLSKSDFYKEYAWVVLSSGMSEKVIKKLFDKISGIFNNWRNPALIINNRTKILNNALKLFNNLPKISALLEMADYLSKKTCSYIINSIRTIGTSYLMSFKFLGPATALHLAKNLGIDIAKPDRHLIRIANLFGYNCPNRFCEIIASVTGEKKSVIDIILWRYATLNKNYLSIHNA